MKKTITDIQNNTQSLVCLTAYTASIASIADNYCDLLLVGDSVAMVIYGEDTTRAADMDMMVRHGKAVTKSTQQAFIVVDMPYGSYENDMIDALTNAQRLIDETNCDAVKLEGGQDMAETIAYLVQNDIPVMAHIGLTPQSVETPDGYRVQGKTEEAAEQLMIDAYAVQKAGAFSLVIEAVPEQLAEEITNTLSIPTIGIGASAACDGQILVCNDMLGLNTGHVPKFVKQYGKEASNIATAIKTYSEEVKSRAFPEKQHTYLSQNKIPLKKVS